MRRPVLGVCRPQFVADLEARLPFYAERHVVKPGITGWAQINFPYGASVEDARQKLEYDLYYAKNYTPFLDLLILPWHSVDLGGLQLDVDTTRSGVQDPNGGYGVAAVLLTI